MKEIILGGDISVYLFIGGFLIYQHKVRKNTKLVLQKYEKTLNKAVDDNKNEFFVKEKIAILTKEEKEKFQKITQKLKQCNDSIYEFYCELSRHTEPESRRNFIRNITSASLEIADNKLQKNCDYESFYDQTKNKLTIYKQMPETLTHDLIHLSSNNRAVNTLGFYKTGKYKDEIYEIGIGLNEGYTEVLNQRFFEPLNVNSPKLVRLSSLIEKFYQNPKNMEKDYFDACLENLILELTKSMDIKDAINIILKIDYISFHPNDRIFYNKLIKQLIELYRQSHKRQETKEFMEEAKKQLVKKK